MYNMKNSPTRNYQMVHNYQEAQLLFALIRGMDPQWQLPGRTGRGVGNNEYRISQRFMLGQKKQEDLPGSGRSSFSIAAMQSSRYQL